MCTKIAVIGMGKTGCAIAQFLATQGMTYDAFDEHLLALPQGLDCTLYTGALQQVQLQHYDCLALSPGINWQHPVLKSLRQQGKKMMSDLDLFSQHFKGDMLAITGTNGKTTVATLLHQLLDVPAIGNIGTPMLSILNEQHPQAVLELSSFQLQRSAIIHPKYAVLLNVQADHVDMHESAQDYEQAKLRLFAAQQTGDWAMLPVDPYWNNQANHLQERGVSVRRFGQANVQPDVGFFPTSKGEAIFWQQGKHHLLCQNMPVQGRHQHLNLAIVAQIASDLGLAQEKIQHMLQTFTGLAHRMQYVGHYHGRDWFNDSKATNPAAAIAALNACQQVGWICGGLRKGIDLMPMVKTVHTHVRHAWVIGTEPDAYVAMLSKAKVNYHVVDTLEAAVEQAKHYQPACPILLSPAAASMDQFLNYAQRGDHFMTYLKEA